MWYFSRTLTLAVNPLLADFRESVGSGLSQWSAVIQSPAEERHCNAGAPQHLEENCDNKMISVDT